MRPSWGSATIIVGSLGAGFYFGHLTSPAGVASAVRSECFDSDSVRATPVSRSEHKQTPKPKPIALPPISRESAAMIKCAALTPDLQVTRAFQVIYGLSDEQCAIVHAAAAEFIDTARKVETGVAEEIAPTGKTLGYVHALRLEPHESMVLILPSKEPRIVAAHQSFVQQKLAVLDAAVSQRIGLHSESYMPDYPADETTVEVHAWVDKRKPDSAPSLVVIKKIGTVENGEFIVLGSDESFLRAGDHRYDHLFQFDGTAIRRTQPAR